MNPNIDTPATGAVRVCELPNAPAGAHQNTATERPQVFHGEWTPPAWLHELASGEDGLIAELIDTFRTTTETRLRQMRTALATHNVSRLRTEVHRTKGSASQLGADALAEVCQSLEVASSLTPTTSRLAELVDSPQQMFDEVDSAMTPYSNGKQSASGCSATELGGYVMSGSGRGVGL